MGDETPPSLDLSVVLCTCDPAATLLQAALESLSRQSMPRATWELVLVDNGSRLPLTEDLFLGLNLPGARLIREPCRGLARARRAGFVAARGRVLVCVDDDNELAPDYLQQAWRIARANPGLGVWGGRSEPAFEVPPLTWTRPLLDHLAIRDYGRKVITSRRQEWGPWDPIGAGMVLRRAVAAAYVDFLANDHRGVSLGRTPELLLGGEDTLLNRLGNRLGFACSYQPSLRLTHHIRAHRLGPRYLRRLLYAQGVTQARLALLLGTGLPPLQSDQCRGLLRQRWAQRRRELGRCGPIQWYWDLGFALETRRLLGEDTARSDDPAGAGARHG